MCINDNIECTNDLVAGQATKACVRRIVVLTRKRAGRQWIVDDKSISKLVDDRQAG